MPAGAPAPIGAAGLPPADWLALVNRQALAVRLISTTVHDVNNILQVVSGAAEVLALDPTPAAVAKRTTSIVGQATAATSVLAGLVNFVRADGSAQDGAKALAVASQALGFRQHAFRKGRIAASANGDDVEAAMPRHHLQQVLLNLVVNAEHVVTGKGDGRIQVTVSGGDAIVVDVDDNGAGWPAGIDAAIAAWPAQPGPSAGALGLGLRVSRELVERAGGTLACVASPLGGARARITLPALRR